ncbi:adenosylcobyric acid synthase (glutamine-hydrolysing) [Gloeocapsa sp. PCC 73106]|nr:adenosylcobyric acid synthase (glutamine-hydrolysing) [Gloeocapsa sp. PCC 73106]
MVVGTTSHAGKSFLTSALCRILAREGIRVTPFKGQNMALNAYVTESGGEIGHAQAVQAWAAKTQPRVEMNPILLKPQGNMTSQVIIKGQVAGITSAQNYYRQYFHRGWKAITESLAILKQNYDVIVCEGAGSPAEINLKHRDLTNMRVAKYLNAKTILIVDIDRGGAFAHVVGTLALLDPDERSLIKGIVINKFRGALSLLESGIRWLEDYTGIPVLGVIPWTERLLPPEDSLDLLERQKSCDYRDLTIKVIRLPYIANFTDFDPLAAENTVSLEYIHPDEMLGHPDAVIIPGSKTTISDLRVLEKSGMARQLQQYAAQGGTILGICGGFQMLGEKVLDLEGLEGDQTSYLGLNLLPTVTTITRNKITRQRKTISYYPEQCLPIEGYEIHQGRTELITAKFQREKFIFDDSSLGIVNEAQTIWGCYLHGLLDNSCWRRSWLNLLRSKRGLEALPNGVANYQQQREATLEAIADFVAANLDLSLVEELKTHDRANTLFA